MIWRGNDNEFIFKHNYKLSRKLRMKPHIRILRYEGAESPMVVGFLKPVLVLPDCDYSEEELFFVLQHEMIHIKRHDVLAKLLFAAANALHWFNPLIYIMRKEAVVDMELSCDEKVIQQAEYAVRKAYTETLLSTFSRQHKRGNFLTTQFYGGKKIMKKRFKNILAKSPKKNGLLLCICAVCITLISGMLIGCSASKKASPAEPAQAGSGTVNAPNPPEQPSESEENPYKSILLGKGVFLCADLANKSLNISEIGQAVTDDDSVTVSATKFAMADLDGDGEDEAVLWLQINGVSDYGFEILHAQNGEVYGYTLQYRAFMNLKTDGTFLFSGGAADSGIGRMSFSETGYRVSGQAYSQSGYDADNELIVQYFVNDESCSEDEFHDAMNAQEQKADVEWRDLGSL